MHTCMRLNTCSYTQLYIVMSNSKCKICLLLSLFLRRGIALVADDAQRNQSVGACPCHRDPPVFFTNWSIENEPGRGLLLCLDEQLLPNGTHGRRRSYTFSSCQAWSDDARVGLTGRKGQGTTGLMVLVGTGRFGGLSRAGRSGTQSMDSSMDGWNLGFQRTWCSRGSSSRSRSGQ